MGVDIFGNYMVMNPDCGHRWLGYTALRESKTLVDCWPRRFWLKSKPITLIQSYSRYVTHRCFMPIHSPYVAQNRSHVVHCQWHFWLTRSSKHFFWTAVTLMHSISAVLGWKSALFSMLDVSGRTRGAQNSWTWTMAKLQRNHGRPSQWPRSSTSHADEPARYNFNAQLIFLSFSPTRWAWEWEIHVIRFWGWHGIHNMQTKPSHRPKCLVRSGK